jgi:hypothetical protein
VTAPYEVEVSSKYGAPMGRRSSGSIEGLVHLRKVRLYDGCYDKGGAYWGGPYNLWCAWNEESVVYFRAPNREAAKMNPALADCKFYK